jgi:hypothetical protein
MLTTHLLLGLSRGDNSIPVNPNVGAQNRPSYHAILILQNGWRNTRRCNMLKVTFLADPRTKAGTPRMLGPRHPHSMVLAQCYLTETNKGNK